MRQLMLTLILAVIAMPAMAQEHSPSRDGWLSPVKAEYVCMVNNQSYDSPQIAVEVEGKTYYGCCSMCKARLEKDTTIRAAVDPVSVGSVDKAAAVIGTDADKTVYYFESEENFNIYADRPKPDAHGQGSMDDMHGQSEAGGVLNKDNEE